MQRKTSSETKKLNIGFEIDMQAVGLFVAILPHDVRIVGETVELFKSLVHKYLLSLPKTQLDGIILDLAKYPENKINNFIEIEI